MGDDDDTRSPRVRIPVVREEAGIRRRRRVTGRVRVHKRVHERVEEHETDVRIEGVEVERVPVGRYVDEVPPVREEGDVVVVPRVREVLVVQRRLLLEEEVRVRRTARTERARVRVPLRSEEVVVHRQADNVTEEETMKTIVALYPEAGPAQRAREELVQFGVNRRRIESYDGGGRHEQLSERLQNGGVESSHVRWYLDGLQKGGSLLVVEEDDRNAQQVAGIMRRHGALQPGTGFPGRAQAGQTTARTPTAGTPSPGTSGRTEGTGRGERAGHIDVVEEEMHVGKRMVEEDGVRVEKHVVERPFDEDVELRRERVDVERHPVNRELRPDEADRAFRDATMEFEERHEEPVVEKRARVVEEIDVGKHVETERRHIHDTTRRTEVHIERLGSGDFHRHEAGFRSSFDRSYGGGTRRWEDYRPAYELGYRFGTDTSWRDREWAEVEPHARDYWTRNHARNGSWDDVRDAVHEGWRRTRATA